MTDSNIIVTRHEYVKGMKLPHGYAIELERNKETGKTFVFFCSQSHVKKRTECTMSFRDDFSTESILSDDRVLKQFFSRYGLHVVTKIEVRHY